MNKTLILPFLALAALLPAALPAQAANTGQSVPSCSGSNSISDDADTIAQMLRVNGFNASSVDEWNGCVRAFITQPDGTQTMAFFDPETLLPVGRSS